LNPFDYINDISENKKNIVANSENPELAANLYQPYLTNMAFSYYQDTVYMANLMNQNSHINNNMQYDFLFSIIRKRKRFSKWHKTKKDENAEVIMEYYACSFRRAQEYAAILSEEQMKIIKSKVLKGGIQ
jgi:hypothetical protein